ncbi:hypothetical protein RFI_19269, partial [Reticulomyxa filosa]
FFFFCYFKKKAPLQHWMWEFANELEHSGMCTCPENVAFVFADNKPNVQHRLIERSYEKCNRQTCHYFHVAKDYHPWDWYGKLGPLNKLVYDDPTFLKRFDYLVLTDADDQTLTRSPHDIVERFLSYDCDILLAGEATSYPHWMAQESAFENQCSPWSRHHQHVNAGGLMIKLSAFRPYLDYIDRDYKNFTIMRASEIAETGKNRWRDQTCWRQMLLRFYPRMKVDSLAKIWTRVDIFLNDL